MKNKDDSNSLEPMQLPEPLLHEEDGSGGGGGDDDDDDKIPKRSRIIKSEDSSLSVKDMSVLGAVRSRSEQELVSVCKYYFTLKPTS